MSIIKFPFPGALPEELEGALTFCLGEEIGVVAGGAVLHHLFCTDKEDIFSGPPKDFDLYFFSKQAYDHACEMLGEPKSENEYNRTYSWRGLEVQLMHFQQFSNVEEVFDSFDITACQVASDGHMIYATPIGLGHAFAKKISLHNISKPYSTFHRVMKYQHQKGFSCTSDVYRRLAERMAVPGALDEDPYFNGILGSH